MRSAHSLSGSLDVGGVAGTVQSSKAGRSRRTEGTKMDERTKTVAVAELLAEASRALGAARALGGQGWTTREARQAMEKAAGAVDLAHAATLRATSMYPEG